jgi:hypothetical protein
MRFGYSFRRLILKKSIDIIYISAVGQIIDDNGDVTPGAVPSTIKAYIQAQDGIDLLEDGEDGSKEEESIIVYTLFCLETASILLISGIQYKVKKSVGKPLRDPQFWRAIAVNKE